MTEIGNPYVVNKTGQLHRPSGSLPQIEESSTSQQTHRVLFGMLPVDACRRTVPGPAAGTLPPQRRKHGTG